MSEPSVDYYGLQVLAALDGDSVALQVECDAAALAIVFADQVPQLARVLAGAAGGIINETEAAQLIQADAPMRQAVVDLSSAQAGDVTIGQVAGRDVVTINVYVGSQGGTDASPRKV